MYIWLPLNIWYHALTVMSFCTNSKPCRIRQYNILNSFLAKFWRCELIFCNKQADRNYCQRVFFILIYIQYTKEKEISMSYIQSISQTPIYNQILFHYWFIIKSDWNVGTFLPYTNKKNHYAKKYFNCILIIVLL